MARAFLISEDSNKSLKVFVESRLHLVFGPPAAGKTTYARALAARIGGVLLDSDEVCERLVRAGLSLAGMDPDDRDSAVYKTAYRDAVYETLFDIARANLPHVPVVIAGPFTKEGADAGWPAWLERRLGAKPAFYFVWCQAQKRRERIIARGAERDRPKLKNWENYVASCREQPPVFPHEFVVTG